MKTSYEWAVETIEDGEIIDVNHYSTLPDAEAASKSADLIYLVRRVHCAINLELLDRQYAPLINGVLPDVFDGGAEVPTKFKKK